MGWASFSSSSTRRCRSKVGELMHNLESCFESNTRQIDRLAFAHHRRYHTTCCYHRKLAAVLGLRQVGRSRPPHHGRERGGVVPQGRLQDRAGGLREDGAAAAADWGAGCAWRRGPRRRRHRGWQPAFELGHSRGEPGAADSRAAGRGRLGHQRPEVRLLQRGVQHFRARGPHSRHAQG